VGRGLAAFLQKPFRAEDLDGAVQRVLGKPMEGGAGSEGGAA
jgi:hypothetical protein